MGILGTEAKSVGNPSGTEITPSISDSKTRGLFSRQGSPSLWYFTSSVVKNFPTILIPLSEPG